MADVHLNERIRERAYQLWQEEGMPEGRADAHWDNARRQILAEDEGSAASPPSEAAPKPEPGKSGVA